jgi:hypothetical protein
MESTQTQIRMAKPLRDRIQKFRNKFQKKTGAQLTFSEAVRTLLEQALSTHEQGP